MKRSKNTQINHVLDTFSRQIVGHEDLEVKPYLLNLLNLLGHFNQIFEEHVQFKHLRSKCNQIKSRHMTRDILLTSFCFVSRAD